MGVNKVRIALVGLVFGFGLGLGLVLLLCTRVNRDAILHRCLLLAKLPNTLERDVRSFLLASWQYHTMTTVYSGWLRPATICRPCAIRRYCTKKPKRLNI